MNFLLEQRAKAIQDLEKTNIQSRLEDRMLWDKLITLILAILGFGLTLFSTELLSEKIIVSCSKYFLLTSWILYCVSLFVGFFLLKKETLFQRAESLRNTLYALDNSELLDDMLKVKEDKKSQFIALQILHGERIGSNDFWSPSAKTMYEQHKKELNSYEIVSNPEKFYSPAHKKIIVWSERIFYSLIIIATISLIISVSLLFFRSQ